MWTNCFNKWFCEIVEHLWCLLSKFWILLKGVDVFSYGFLFVPLFTGAFDRGKRCSPVPLAAASEIE